MLKISLNLLKNPEGPRVEMRINEYKSLADFCKEYDIKYVNEKWERSIGIEFIYNGVYYRMCREPLSEEKRPILKDGKRGIYDVMIVHWKGERLCSDFEYEIVGWYSDFEEMLENCMLQGQPFKKVIMDDNTEIVGKD